jgi:hypothetical protein
MERDFASRHDVHLPEVFKVLKAEEVVADGAVKLAIEVFDYGFVTGFSLRDDFDSGGDHSASEVTNVAVLNHRDQFSLIAVVFASAVQIVFFADPHFNLAKDDG